jgi:hypothetical protein
MLSETIYKKCNMLLNNFLLYEMKSEGENLYIDYSDFLDWKLPALKIKVNDLRYRKTLVSTLVLMFPVTNDKFIQLSTLKKILAKQQFRLRKLIILEETDAKVEGWVQELPIFQNLFIDNVTNINDDFCKIIWKNENE